MRHLAQTPLDPVLADTTASRELVCFVLDPFTREGGEPRSLETAATRRLDLILGNQTRHSLAAHMRIRELQAGIARLAERLPAALSQDAEIAAVLKEGNAQSGLVLSLSYAPPPDEPGPERQFDFSSLAIIERWKSGNRDMERALRILNAAPPRRNGLTAHIVQPSPTQRV
jgi:NTE family protein